MDTFNYQRFFHSIKNRVSQARINFSRQANREANALYWFIGEMIVKNQEFYLEYKGHEKWRQLVAELSWGSNLLIMNKIKDPNAREYYLRATIEMGWTRNVLGLQIESQAYERQCLEGKTHNFEQAMTKHLAEQADKSLKSVYSLNN